MKLKHRVEKLEKTQNLSGLCQCSISDLPEILTARQLSKVCQRCGKSRTDSQISRFSEMSSKGRARLQTVTQQIEARNYEY